MPHAASAPSALVARARCFSTLALSRSHNPCQAWRRCRQGCERLLRRPCSSKPSSITREQLADFRRVMSVHQTALGLYLWVEELCSARKCRLPPAFQDCLMVAAHEIADGQHALA